VSDDQPEQNPEPSTDSQPSESVATEPPPPPVAPQPRPSGPPGNRISRAAKIAGPLTAGLMCLVLVAFLVYQQQQTIQSLANQVASQQSALNSNQDEINALKAEIKDLKERWYGSPAVWQPPPISNTDFVFFDVTGTTQQELIDSLDQSNICATYGPCAVDPAVPSGVAWGLEGSHSESTYCYAPGTTTVVWTQRVVLPRWSPPADGTVKIPLVERWNALAKVIYTHEAGHVTIDQQDLADLNRQAQGLGSCDAWLNFWNDPHRLDKMNADQLAYHARLRADCRPEIGCIPPGWMGW